MRELGGKAVGGGRDLMHLSFSLCTEDCRAREVVLYREFSNFRSCTGLGWINIQRLNAKAREGGV